MRTKLSIGVALASVLSLAQAGCGGDGTKCGAGTVKMDGACVPESTLECATGTKLVGNQCVPDGTVICETGTTYNDTTGKCDPDITGCAAGTVLVGGECIPEDDALVADVMEPAEPNGFNGTPGSLTLPAEGGQVTIKGCITPTVDADMNGNLDPDWDLYLFDTTGPALIDVTVDGLGGLAGGFQVVSADAELGADGWFRLGINLVGDTSQRQVFLPKAGTYGLAISDSRSVFFGEGAGSADTCYFATLKNLPVPVPTPLAGGMVSGTLGDPMFVNLTATDGQVVFNTMTAPSDVAAGSFVQLVNGQYAGSTPFGDLGDDATSFLAALSSGDDVTFVLDHVVNFGLSPQSFDFVADDVNAQLADGDVTITHVDGELAFLYFPATAGDVVRIQFNGNGDGFQVLAGDGDLNVIGNRCGDCTTDDFWLQIQETGFHYLGIFNNDGTDGTDYTVTITRTDVTPTPLAVGTPAAGSLAGADRAFYVLDTSASDWLEYAVTSMTNMTTGAVRFYDRSAEGDLDGLVPQLDSDISDGTPFGRIHADVGGVFLVSVEDDAGHDGDESFDFSVTNKVFTDLGMSPATATDEMLGAGESAAYLLRTTAGNRSIVTVTGKSGADVVVDRLSRTEAVLGTTNDTGTDGAEVVTALTGDTVLAFVVRESGGAAATYDIGTVEQTPMTVSDAPGLVIPDGVPAGVDTTLSFGSTCTIGVITVDVDISHTWVGDLVIELVSPTGTTVLLRDRSGGSADDIVGTYPTTLTPVDSLDTLLGEEAMGTWTLHLEDHASLDEGTLNSWGINLFCD